jgi:hypothetical protein
VATLIHRLPPIDRDPEVGDLCRLGGPGSMPTNFFRKHGVGMVIDKKVHPSTRVANYEVKWLKSEERMRFFKEDLIIVSNVD